MILFSPGENYLGYLNEMFILMREAEIFESLSLISLGFLKLKE
jgi:hypothetical protein